MDRIVGFLREIGLVVRVAEIEGPTVLPGIKVVEGGLVVDPARLKYPGDLLHEAGHLAVMPAARRAQANDDTGSDGGEEMAAIAWSYAAAVRLELDARVVFHEAGYRGGSDSMVENFAAGRYIGVPILVWLGMTERYPEMLRWLA
jgi:hypothetical protein